MASQAMPLPLLLLTLLALLALLVLLVLLVLLALLLLLLLELLLCGATYTHGICSSSSGSSGSLFSGCSVGSVRFDQDLNTFLQLPSTSSFRQRICRGPAKRGI